MLQQTLKRFEFPKGDEGRTVICVAEQHGQNELSNLSAPKQETASTNSTPNTPESKKTSEEIVFDRGDGFVFRHS